MICSTTRWSNSYHNKEANMANIVRANGTEVAEAKLQFATAANTIAKLVTEAEELTEEEKEIREKIKERNAKELARLREIAQRKKLLKEQQLEAIGGYKLALKLLSKWKVEAPRTKLAQLSEKNEQIAQLVG